MQESFCSRYAVDRLQELMLNKNNSFHATVQKLTYTIQRLIRSPGVQFRLKGTGRGGGGVHEMTV